jgi:peptidoglycan/xylan/chitin deacetylase (PgdA/CDA1 family)
MSPNRWRRGARFTGSVALLAGLLVAAGLWVVRTRPYDPAQHQAPAVAVAARDFPVYRDAPLVLQYHDISSATGSPSTITPHAFAGHLDTLRKAGFHSVRLADVEAMMSGSPVRLPPRPVLLTFDDGLASNWLDADPVLQRYGFTAVAFLVTGAVTDPHRPSSHLSTEQVRRMAASGRWEFGGHTDDLHHLAAVRGGTQAPALINRLAGDHEETLAQWEARVRADLLRSQRFFQDVLGRPVRAFAFPYGAADHPSNDPAIPGRLPRLLGDAGFRFGFTGEDRNRGEQQPVTPDADPYRLPRVTVTGDLDPAGLLAALRKAAPDPITADLTTLGWSGVDVRCTVRRTAGHAPALRVSSSGYGRCTAPVNPVQWTDYRLTTGVAGGDRAATAFIGVRAGRTTGGRDRAEVVLGEAVVRIREQVGARVEVLAARRLPPGGDRRVDITVKGDRITVRVDRGRPMTARLAPALAAGAVDFGIATHGARTLDYLGPRLVDLRSPPVT